MGDGPDNLNGTIAGRATSSCNRLDDAPDSGGPHVSGRDREGFLTWGQVIEIWDSATEPPDVFRFLQTHSPKPTPDDLIAGCLADQHERWVRGFPRPVEVYWNFLKLRIRDIHIGTLWEFASAEWRLRKEHTEYRQPELADFIGRFPSISGWLRVAFGEGDCRPMDSTRDLMSGADRSVIDTSEGLDPTGPATRASQARPIDVDATTIELDEDEDSVVTLNEFEYEHDPESLLGQSQPFSRLPPALLDRIEERLEPTHFDNGELLIREGDPGDGLFVIHSGQVEVRSTDVFGDTQTLAHCGRSEILGEMALITDEPRTADVVATSSVEARFLPQTVFDELATDYPVVSQVLTRLLADRLGKPGHDALAGKTLDEYVIHSRLGRGGMAIVYKARHQTTGDDVALKMMNHRLVYDANALELFQREARIIEGFEHDNIVRMLGRFKAFRSFFIVMEFCEGTSLDEVVRRNGSVSADEFRRIVGQIASALSYAHSRDIVHRDIKPSNIMLSSDGRVKLMDFGLAKPVADSGLSKGLVAGTPRYMAPEQLLGQQVDTRADLFALGASGWKLITGRSLIRATTLSGIDEIHQNWELPDVSDLPSDIGEFLTLCLQKNPDDRSVDLGAIAKWA